MLDLRLSFFLFLLLIQGSNCLAQANCQQAVTLTQLQNFCSVSGAYQTSASGKLYWFKFTAVQSEVFVTVTGNTLTTPEIHLLGDCSGTELVGTGTQSPQIATLYKGGLVTGQEYYFTVNGTNVGTFQLCLDNRSPAVRAGQDCNTALLLCSTQGFTQTEVSGGGANSDEARGTCLSSPGELSESNSVWYKWQAATSGTLVFTITPGKTTDDIDFVVYDMGTNGDCSRITGANAIRCAAGHGVSNTACPGEPVYYKVGLDFNETDVTELSGCGQRQNGKLKALDMIAGHYYALMVNNFSSRDNSFRVDFKDQNGQAGTGTFTGPRAEISVAATDTCTANQQYTFASSSSAGAQSLKWTFGQGAALNSSTSPGPHTITYATSGIKTVTLEVTSAQGCTDITSRNIYVSLPPVQPVIVSGRSRYCVGDTILLTTPSREGLSYQWTGPMNFSAAGDTVRIPVQSAAQAGSYQLTAWDLHCSSEAAVIQIGPIIDTPVAAFGASLALPAKVNAPVEIKFMNQSVRADSYSWDFGDGGSSTQVNPIYTYRKPGKYKVKLTAFNNQACQASVIRGNYEILEGNVIAVPPLITPNGDGVNDRLVVSIASVTSYHIQVFNRWGAVVFESHDIFEDWDGTYRGQAVPAGAYFYVIMGVDRDRRQIKKSGSVTLLR